LGGNGEKRPHFRRMNEDEFLNEFLAQEMIWVRFNHKEFIERAMDG
jgi:hypothetical protein